jgi:predicted RNase H-like nuclease (RuvC/YqgF family)
MMDPTVAAALVSGIGALVVAILQHVSQRSQNKVQAVSHERSQLSQDESNFRQLIVQENKDLRSRVDELEEENMRLQRKILKLEAALIKAGMVVIDDDEE